MLFFVAARRLQKSSFAPGSSNYWNYTEAEVIRHSDNLDILSIHCIWNSHYSYLQQRILRRIFHCIAICNLLIIRTSFKKRSYFMQFILCEIKIIASQPIPQGFTDTTWSIIDLNIIVDMPVFVGRGN